MHTVTTKNDPDDDASSSSGRLQADDVTLKVKRAAVRNQGYQEIKELGLLFRARSQFNVSWMSGSPKTLVSWRDIQHSEDPMVEYQGRTTKKSSILRV